MPKSFTDLSIPRSLKVGGGRVCTDQMEGIPGPDKSLDGLQSMEGSSSFRLTEGSLLLIRHTSNDPPTELNQ